MQIQQEIYFTLSKNCTTPDGLPIKTKINHKYRINSETKSEPPVLNEQTQVVRPAISYRGSKIYEPQTLLEAEMNAENENSICLQNHINTNLDFYINGNDFGGGKIHAYITCKRIYNADGTIAKNTVEKELIYNNYNDNLLSQTDEQGNKYVNISFNMLKFSDYQDGMYEFNVGVKDEYDNISEVCKKYYVLCDSQLSKSSNAMIWYETPMFRQDFEEDQETVYPAPYDAQVATEALMEHYRKRVQFLYLVDDIYYISPFGNSKQYIDKVSDFTIMFSWGTDLEHLSEPAPPKSITSYNKTQKEQYYLSFDETNKDKDPSTFIPTTKPDLVPTDGINTANGVTYESFKLDWYWRALGRGDQGSFYTKMIGKIIYELPDSYYNYTIANCHSDVYLQATIIDSVGNTNTIETKIPRTVDFYSYKVEEVKDANEKLTDYKITLNYSDRTGDCTLFTNVPNKTVNSFTRIFYEKIEGSSSLHPVSQDYDTSAIKLKRNCFKPFREDVYSNITDNNVITIPAVIDGENNITPNYVIYIQPNYQTGSLVNGMYTGQTFGTIYKMIIDPTKTGTTGGPAGFSITAVSKESAGVNTGLLNITVTLDKIEEGVTYIPYYSNDPKTRGDDGQIGEWVCVDNCTVSATDKTIKFTIKNPLRPPIYHGEDNSLADYTSTGTHNWDDTWDQWRDTLMDGYYYYDYPYPVKFKVLATKDGISRESSIPESSDVDKIWLSAYADNIPPKSKGDMYTHDSKLDFDGKAFVFDGLVLEEQGHLQPYFTFYYTKYNGVWGNNLTILSEEEIQSLPSGNGYFNFTSCYIDTRDDGDDENDRLVFSYNPVVPVYGLEDGYYMFFGKIEDTYGNYSYVTLGKANIGTFENKPVAVADAKNKSITVNFTREPGEYLQYNYINIQHCNRDEGRWDDVYGEQNALQKLDFNGSTATIVYDKNFTYYDECNDDRNKRVDDNGKRWYEPALMRSTDKISGWNFYRITVQGFNVNSEVKMEYGRPYTEVKPKDSVTGTIDEPWGYKNSWEAGGDYEYNLCTDETVSSSIYVYLPGSGDNGYVEDLSDLKASFFYSNARATSNHAHIVNVLVSARDLGKNADEWERRGKLIKTHYYNNNYTKPNPEWYDKTTDSNGVQPGNPGYVLTLSVQGQEDYERDLAWYNDVFDWTVAQQDMIESDEIGDVYYAAVVHFADGSSAVSETYTMNGIRH